VRPVWATEGAEAQPDLREEVVSFRELLAVLLLELVDCLRVLATSLLELRVLGLVLGDCVAGLLVGGSERVKGCSVGPPSCALPVEKVGEFA
jgi:hypothetical protein